MGWFMLNILPQMVSLSNNSRLTQGLASKLQEKLEPEDLAEFQRWLVLATQEQQAKISQNKRKY